MNTKIKLGDAITAQKSKTVYAWGHGHGPVGPGGHGPSGSSFGLASYTRYGSDAVAQNAWRHTVLRLEFLRRTDWDELEFEAPNDTKTRAEIEKLLEKQEDFEGVGQRNSEIMAECNDFVGTFENLCYFGTMTHPLTSDLVAAVVEIGWDVVQFYKERIRRIRPSVFDSRICPLIRVPSHPAYPSGHATQSRLVAEALKSVLSGTDGYGALSTRLDETADRIGENREWAGVHYATDTSSGRQLGIDLWKRAVALPNFQKFIAAAQEEWRRSIQSGRGFLDHAD